MMVLMFSLENCRGQCGSLTGRPDLVLEIKACSPKEDTYEWSPNECTGITGEVGVGKKACCRRRRQCTPRPWGGRNTDICGTDRR